MSAVRVEIITGLGECSLCSAEATLRIYQDSKSILLCNDCLNVIIGTTLIWECQACHKLNAHILNFLQLPTVMGCSHCGIICYLVQTTEDPNNAMPPQEITKKEPVP